MKRIPILMLSVLLVLTYSCKKDTTTQRQSGREVYIVDSVYTGGSYDTTSGQGNLSLKKGNQWVFTSDSCSGVGSGSTTFHYVTSSDKNTIYFITSIDSFSYVIDKKDLTQTSQFFGNRMKSMVMTVNNQRIVFQ